MRSARFLIVAALVAGFVLAGAVPASAEVPPGVSAEIPSDGYSPSKSKWRKYMLNVTGSILGSSMPQSWQREQIANRFAQGGMPSAEQLNAQFGFTSLERDADGVLRPTAPMGSGTYDDVVIREREKIANKTTTRKGLAVPGTKPANLVKNLGAGATMMTGFPIGFQLGSGVMQLFGMDSAGAVCQGTPEDATILTQFFTGVDCSAWAMSQDFPVNVDIPAGSYGAACYEGFCVQLIKASQTTTSTKAPTFCYSYTGAKSTPNVTLGFPSKTEPLMIASGPVGYWNQAGCEVGQRYMYQSAFSPDTANAPRADWPAGLVAFFPTAVINGQLTITGPMVGQPPTVNSADPDRTLDCTITYTDGTSSRQSSVPFKESAGEVAPISCPPPDPGKTVESVRVDQVGGGVSNTLYDESTTDAYQDWAENSPECATGVCLLDLLIETAPDTYASCFDLEAGCAGWFEDPTKDSKYTCRYGTQEKPLAECAVYAGLFAPGRIEVGSPYSDPLTGTWSGGQNSTRPDRDAMGQSVQNPAVARSCNGMNITGFDPVGFVMRPVQCALEWAFVPRQAVVDLSTAKTELAFKNSFPGKLSTSVAGVGDAFADLGAGNCGGFIVALAKPGPDGAPVIINERFMSACPGDFLYPVAGPVFWGFSAIIIVLGIMAVKLQLDRFVGNT